MEQWRQSRISIYMNDFGELSRYRAANATLLRAAPGENRVVFFGDSITDGWHLDESFPGKPYINRGIGGQTTPQMLVRFRQDVIDLQPKVVVILAGTNDIAGNTGPMSLDDIEANYATLAELARLHGIKFRLFSSVLPSTNTPNAPATCSRSARPKKFSLSTAGSKTTARPDAWIYLDYFSAMVDDKGLLKKDLADDGLHPNAAGYKVMAPLAEAAITTALAAKH